VCTVIVALGVAPDAPLVLAHNRDEFLARPARDVDVWTPAASDRAVVAGRDELSMGTWFAVGPHVTACVTNDRRNGRPAPGIVSRGRLVTDAATASSVDEARERVFAHRAADVGPFHVLVTDATTMVHISNAGGQMRSAPVTPGLHVLGNFDIDDENDPIVSGVKAHLRTRADDSVDELVRVMQGALRAHGEGAPCLHLGVYGTRTAGVVSLGGPREQLWTTAGPSCTTPWRDQSDLLSRVRSSMWASGVRVLPRS
jgi:uncharacterized protein with NRDE domain